MTSPICSYQFQRMTALTPTVCEFILTPTDPTHRINYAAGQYVMLHLSDATSEAKPFSIANAPHPSGELIFHIRHTPTNDFITRLCDQLKTSGQVNVSGPLGTCTLPRDNRALIFIAGGTGLAPHKALIEQALAEGRTDPIHLIWGVNDEASLYFLDTLHAWSASHPSFTFTPVILHASTGWSGHVGMLSDAIHALFSPAQLQQTTLFLAGPYDMIQSIKTDLHRAKVDPQHILSDL